MPHLSVVDNVALGCRLVGMPGVERTSKAMHCLTLVGLDPKAVGDRFPHQLSGGQRQRVGVARALATDPSLILMDEPFGALDPITRRTLQDEFRNLQRSLGPTVILVTHDLREACRMADRLALVDRGQLVQVGRPRDFSTIPPTTSSGRSSPTPGPSTRSRPRRSPGDRVVNDWLTLLRAQAWPLFEATAAHLDLVGEAILIAVAIGVPLGILASRTRWVERRWSAWPTSCKRSPVWRSWASC